MGRLFPAGWDDVIVRTLVAFITAMIALSVKEWVETQRVDVPGVSIDGMWVAAGALVINGLLRMMAPKSA
jgi:hypothetical protein